MQASDHFFDLCYIMKHFVIHLLLFISSLKLELYCVFDLKIICVGT